MGPVRRHVITCTNVDQDVWRHMPSSDHRDLDIRFRRTKGPHCMLLFMTKQKRHYSDITTSAMAFQITGVSIVYSTVCSVADQREHQSTTSLAFVCEGNSPASIWWHHHVQDKEAKGLASSISPTYAILFTLSQRLARAAWRLGHW